MTLDEAMDLLENDLDREGPEAVSKWLENFSAPGGLAEGVLLARQGQRRRVCTLLCRLAIVAEAEIGAHRAIYILATAERCCSLPPVARYQAASLAIFCHDDTPFARRLYRWAISSNITSLISGLRYLTRPSLEAQQYEMKE